MRNPNHRLVWGIVIAACVGLVVWRVALPQREGAPPAEPGPSSAPRAASEGAAAPPSGVVVAPADPRSAVELRGRIRVLDARGAGVSDAVLLLGRVEDNEFLESVTKALPHFHMVVKANVATSYGLASVHRTDAAGDCLLLVPPGPNRVLVAHPGMSMYVGDCAVTPGGASEIVLADAVTVAIRFAGKPPRSVQVHYQDKPLLEVLPDAEGRCATPPLPTGDHEFLADGYEPERRFVPATGPELTVLMMEASRSWSALLCSDDGQAYDESRLRYEFGLGAATPSFLFSDGPPGIEGFANDRQRPQLRYDGATGRLSADLLPSDVMYVGVWVRFRLICHARIDRARQVAIIDRSSPQATAEVSFVVNGPAGRPLDTPAAVDLGVLVGASFGSVARVAWQPGSPCRLRLAPELVGAEVWCRVGAAGFVPEWQRVRLPAREGASEVTVTLRAAAHALHVEAPGAEVIACVTSDNRWVTDHQTTIRTTTGVENLGGLPSGRLRLLAWNGTSFGHQDLSLPDAGVRATITLTPGLPVVLDNPMDRPVQLVAFDAVGTVVFDDRLFGNQRHGLRLPCTVPVDARELAVLDSSGRSLARVRLPLPANEPVRVQ